MREYAAGNMGYLIFLQPATSPKFERKPIYWIMSEVAKRLGKDVYDQFTPPLPYGERGLHRAGFSPSPRRREPG
jgi:anaerobic selenocysteine-containing dehydrogenase